MKKKKEVHSSLNTGKTKHRHSIILKERKIQNTDIRTILTKSHVSLFSDLVMFDRPCVAKGSNPEKKIQNPNRSRHLFSALIWTFSRGGGGG